MYQNAEPSILHATISVMNKHPERYIIQGSGCETILDMITESNNCEFMSVGVQQVVQTAMDTHRQCAWIQEVGCMTFMNLYYRVDVDAQNIVESEKNTCAVMNAMREFPTNERIQLYACGAMVNMLCNQNTLADKAVEKGGVELLLACMCRFKNHDHTQLQEWACGSLRNIAYVSREHKNVIVESNGIHIIMTSMYWCQSETLSRHGCALLMLISLNDNVCISTMYVRCVMDAMIKFPNNLDIQRFGCYTLNNISKNNPMELYDLKEIKRIVACAKEVCSENKAVQRVSKNILAL